MLLCISMVLVFFLFACWVVVVTWTLHLPNATALCEQITALGKGDSGQFSLDVVGSGRECEFPTAGGLMLRGTYMHSRPFSRLGVMVFCHEFGGDRHVAVPYMAELLDAGFDIFTFDFRNHGKSESLEGYTPRTWATHYEVLDVQGAIAYLRSLEDSDPQGVALVGRNRGGSAAMSVASRSDGIWALVTDGAFDSRWVVTAHIRRFMEHFVWLTPVLRPLPWFIHVIYGSFVHNRVARKLKHPCIHLANDARRVRLPLLTIHGARDSTIPVELAYRLRKKLPKRPRRWIVPKSRHNQALARDPARYRRRICRFLKNHAPGALRQFPSVGPGVIPHAASHSENTVNVARERLPAFGSTALFEGIHRELQQVKTGQLGRTFLRSLRIRRYLLARSVRNGKCGATAALTNIGETLQDSLLQRHEDRLIAGNLVLDAADFLAPIRPMTCASFSVCTYAGRLSICLQYDRRALNEPAADLLFETFLQQLQNNLRFSQ